MSVLSKSNIRNNFDGVVNYEVAYGAASPVFANLKEGFMDADGIKYDDLGSVDDLLAINQDNFYAADSIDYENLGDNDDLIALKDDNFYGANGRLRRKIAQNRKRRQTRRDTRMQSRLATKQTYADAQKKAADAMQKGAIADKKLAEALAKTSAEPTKKSLSTGAIVGIVLGGVALLGLVAYFVIKNKAKVTTK